VDFDLQHDFSAGDRHGITLATGYRAVRTAFGESSPIRLTPAKKVDRLFSGFAQDEIRLGDSAWLTVGSKLEHKAYTGFELEPSLRFAWTPLPRHAFWAAAAHAVRRPARSDLGIHVAIATIPAGALPETVIRLDGNPLVHSEQVRDIEAGYRAQLAGGFSIDAAGYYGHYHGLMTADNQQPYLDVQSGVVRIMQPLMYGNGARAESYGGESSLAWGTGRWRFSAGYAYRKLRLESDAAANPDIQTIGDNDSPRNAVVFRSMLNLTRSLQWDQSCSAQSVLAGSAGHRPIRLETRLAWRAAEHLDLSFIGQNLFRSRYVEFNRDSWIVGSYNQPRLMAKVTWSF
jgi:iron complex outermembrane receptor protein